jgi:hypothetical protein
MSTTCYSADSSTKHLPRWSWCVIRCSRVNLRDRMIKPSGASTVEFEVLGSTDKVNAEPRTMLQPLLDGEFSRVSNAIRYVGDELEPRGPSCLDAANS